MSDLTALRAPRCGVLRGRGLGIVLAFVLASVAGCEKKEPETPAARDLRALLDRVDEVLAAGSSQAAMIACGAAADLLLALDQRASHRPLSARFRRTCNEAVPLAVLRTAVEKVERARKADVDGWPPCTESFAYVQFAELNRLDALEAGRELLARLDAACPGSR